MTTTSPSSSNEQAFARALPMSGEATRTARRLPVSVVCVFNKPAVLQHCLVRSIEADRHRAPDTELITVDNAGGRFASAGAALNHGARQARNDYVVFVHQDVYIHSLSALEEAAGILAAGEFGLLGAIGMRADGSLAGRIRDRVVLSGDVAPRPEDVDSLDEVIFIAPRALILDEPLSEAEELSWHAYAVEYGLRIRSRGLRVGAVHMPVTHNSLTVNLDKLDVAHAAVGALYPTRLPVRTTCGTITPRTGQRRRLASMAGPWYRWLRESYAVRSARRAAPAVPVVLSDIRLEIDDLLTHLDEPLAIVNLGPEDDPFVGDETGALTLDRLDRTIRIEPARIGDIGGQVRSLARSVLVTNVGTDTLRSLVPALKGHAMRLGHQEDAGTWLAVGAAANVELPAWRLRRARPLGASRR